MDRSTTRNNFSRNSRMLHRSRSTPRIDILRQITKTTGHRATSSKHMRAEEKEEGGVTFAQLGFCR